MKYLPYVGLLVAVAIIMGLATALIIYIKLRRQSRSKPTKKFSLMNKLFARQGDEPFDGNPDEILNKKNN